MNQNILKTSVLINWGNNVNRIITHWYDRENNNAKLVYSQDYSNPFRIYTVRGTLNSYRRLRNSKIAEYIETFPQGDFHFEIFFDNQSTKSDMNNSQSVGTTGKLERTGNTVKDLKELFISVIEQHL